MVDELIGDVKTACLASAAKVSDSRVIDEELISIELGILHKHENPLRALLPSDDGTLAKRLAAGIEDAYVEAAMMFGEQGASLEHHLGCAYSAWAAWGMVQRWLEQPARSRSCYRIIRISRRASGPGLQGIL
jgi:hypothetical protein